jgi:hypothetical protein
MGSGKPSERGGGPGVDENQGGGEEESQPSTNASESRQQPGSNVGPVMEPRIDITKTIIWLHTKQPNALSADEYMTYNNAMVLSDQNRHTHLMMQEILVEFKKEQLVIQGRGSGRASSSGAVRRASGEGSGGGDDEATPAKKAAKTPKAIKEAAKKHMDLGLKQLLNTKPILEVAYLDWVVEEKHAVSRLRTTATLQEDMNGFFDTQLEKWSDLATVNYCDTLRALPDDVKEELYLTIGREFTAREPEATRVADTRAERGKPKAAKSINRSRGRGSGSRGRRGSNRPATASGGASGDAREDATVNTSQEPELPGNLQSQRQSKKKRKVSIVLPSGEEHHPASSITGADDDEERAQELKKAKTKKSTAKRAPRQGGSARKGQE